MIMFTNSDPPCVTSVPRRQTNAVERKLPAPLLSLPTTKTWQLWIKVINPEDIITVGSKAESSINIYITFSLM